MKVALNEVRLKPTEGLFYLTEWCVLYYQMGVGRGEGRWQSIHVNKMMVLCKHSYGNVGVVSHCPFRVGDKRLG